MICVVCVYLTQAVKNVISLVSVQVAWRFHSKNLGLQLGNRPDHVLSPPSRNIWATFI